MGTRVFRFPAGLLELLSSKASGQNPAELGELVSPTLDLMPFYQAGFPVKFAVFTSGTVIAPGGVNSGFVVPQNKWWIPLLHTAWLTAIGAGDGGRVQPSLLDSSANPFSGGNYMATVAASTSRTPLSSFPWYLTPILIPSGMEFGAWVDDITVATTGISVRVNLAYIEVGA